MERIHSKIKLKIILLLFWGLVEIKVEVNIRFLLLLGFLFRASNFDFELSLYFLLGGFYRPADFHPVELFVDEVLNFISFFLLRFSGLNC